MRAGGREEAAEPRDSPTSPQKAPMSDDRPQPAPLTGMVPPGRDQADPEADHLTCCDPDISMCGLDVSGQPAVEKVSDDDVCRVCRIHEEYSLPCPVPGCDP